MTIWDEEPTEGTAAGQPVVVVADGVLVAALTPLWDDETGIRGSLDWLADDLSESGLRALAAALAELADAAPPGDARNGPS
ncbi:hypothetical protein [Humibacter ginsengiterrae]